jgi:hypothetical protein
MPRLTLRALDHLSIGRKDMSKSRTDVYDAVFNNRPNKVHTMYAQMLRADMSNDTSGKHNKDEHAALSKHDKLSALHSLLMDNGECGKIIEGLHQNYLSINYNDPTFDKTVDVLDWIAYSDEMEHRSMVEIGDSDMSMYQYIPYAACNMHIICSKPKTHKYDLSNSSYARYQEHAAKMMVLRTFLAPT